MSKKRADEILQSGYIQLVCDSADIIIIADIATDARPFLQSLASSSGQYKCKSKIAMELTNRFDWKIPDTEEYYRLLATLITKTKPDNLFWIANNPYEGIYMRKKIHVSPVFRLLRSSGITSLPQLPLQQQNESQYAVTNARNWTRVYSEMMHHGIPVLAKKYYGGPKTLAQHIAYIDFPYQVSTMKLYENLREGIFLLVPSRKFFRQLVEANVLRFCCWQEFIDENGKLARNWHMNIDYYRPELRPFITYFGSWKELTDLLDGERWRRDKGGKQLLDQAAERKKSAHLIEKMTLETVQGWKQIFLEMGYTVGGAEKGALDREKAAELSSLKQIVPVGVRYLERGN
ncbi:hypothetical protein BDR26DRAFT_184269 [Obelidium mucronatum]|nr:hypothetical protein BDR26DRAFT_184269 [Obelidium mucronatum]